MNPTVLAAAIGVGGTVIVGVTGFWASVRNTGKTVSLARESRIWDRRAKAYVDIIAALEWQLRLFGPHRRIFPEAGDLGPPNWEKLETSLQAWASESVLTAMKASAQALEYIFAASIRPPDPPDQLVSASPSPDAGLAAISTLENLIELMRSELQGRKSGLLGHRQRRHLPG